MIKWHDDDKYFCKDIRFVEHAKDVIRKSNMVIIIGSNGAGKTATARHCALNLQGEGWNVFPILDVGEIMQHHDANAKQIFVLDDPIGILCLNNRKAEYMKAHLKDMFSDFKNEKHKLVITCRKVVYNEAKFYHSFDNFSVVDLENEKYSLNMQEKLRMLQIYSIDSLVDQSSLDKIKFMFPLLCYLVFRDKDNLLNSEESNVHLVPHEYLLKQLDTMKHDEDTKLSYVSLVFLMLLNNSLTDHDLRHKASLLGLVAQRCAVKTSFSAEIMKKLKLLENTYVVKTEFGYEFQHDSIFEIVAYHFGQENQDLIIKYLSMEYLCNNTDTQCIGKNEMCLIIQEKNFNDLAQRLFAELEKLHPQRDDNTIKHVFHHKCWSNSTFITCVLNQFKAKPLWEKFTKFHEINQSKANENLLDSLKTDPLELDFPVERYAKNPIYWAKRSGEQKRFRFIDWIVCNGHLPFLEELISKRGKKINNPKSFLWLAIYSARKDVLDFILKYISNNNNRSTESVSECVNEAGKSLYTPLTLACSMNAMDVVKYLVENGAQVDKYDLNKRHPLCISIKKKYTAILEYLLKESPLIRSNDNGLPSPFDFALDTGSDILKILLENCHPESTSNDRKTPLHYAVKKCFYETVDRLIANGAKINAKDTIGQTALLLACKKSCAKANNGVVFLSKIIVQTLVENGADVNVCDVNKESPLLVAIRNENKELIRYLLKRHPKVHVGNDTENSGILKLLLENCHHDSTLHGGKTPLHLAVENNFRKIVRDLIARGANINATNKTGQTALHIACRLNNVEIARYLIFENCNTNVKDWQNKIPLHLACQSGNLSLTMLLYNEDAGKCRDVFQKIPRDYVRSHAIQKFLQQKGSDY